MIFTANVWFIRLVLGLQLVVPYVVKTEAFANFFLLQHRHQQFLSAEDGKGAHELQHIDKTAGRIRVECDKSWPLRITTENLVLRIHAMPS